MVPELVTKAPFFFGCWDKYRYLFLNQEFSSTEVDLYTYRVSQKSLCWKKNFPIRIRISNLENPFIFAHVKFFSFQDSQELNRNFDYAIFTFNSIVNLLSYQYINVPI